MRKTLFLFFTMVTAMLFSALSAYAQDSAGSNITVTVPNAVTVDVMTLEGQRFLLDPETGEFYREIEGAALTETEGMTAVCLPSDQTYALWLRSRELFDPVITTPVWTFCLTGLSGAGEDYNMVITPMDRFSEGDFLFEKFQFHAPYGEYPNIEFLIPLTDGKCTFSMKPVYSADSINEKAAGLPSKMVFTLYPESASISAWISAQDPEEAASFAGSEFSFDMAFTCDKGKRSRSAHTPDGMPLTMSENAIFFLDYEAFLKGSNTFFEGDLDGDDLYETGDAQGIFESGDQPVGEKL